MRNPPRATIKPLAIAAAAHLRLVIAADAERGIKHPAGQEHRSPRHAASATHSSRPVSRGYLTHAMAPVGPVRQRLAHPPAAVDEGSCAQCCGLHHGGDPIYESHLACVTGAVAAIAFAFSALAVAASTSEINARVEAALSRFYAQESKPSRARQQSLRDAGVPERHQGRAGVGGEYGEGALQVHGKTVAYYKLTGASAGATLGVARRSEVLLFMTDAALEKFMNSKDWTVGVDAAVAVVKARALNTTARRCANRSWHCVR